MSVVREKKRLSFCPIRLHAQTQVLMKWGLSMKHLFSGFSILLLLICFSLMITGCQQRAQLNPSMAESPSTEEYSAIEKVDNSFEAVAKNISLNRLHTLLITAPEEDIVVNAEVYYIMGASLAEQELLLNGEPVESRGILGSFGVFVSLEEGENVFTFTQASDSCSVTITRDSSPASPTTKSLRNMRPSLDVAAYAGKPYLLSCTAPSGGVVTAQVGDDTIALQPASTDHPDGFPVVFSAEWIPEDVLRTVLLGTVNYTLEYDGETSDYPSGGALYIAGSHSPLLVCGKNVASSVFTEEDDESAHYSILPQDAIDVVTEIGDNMYKLGMGGWVLKQSVTPITDTIDYSNQMQQTEHIVHDGWEEFLLTGTSTPPYYASWGIDHTYELILCHTSALTEIPLQNSELLSALDIRTEGAHTVLSFSPKDGVALGGYLVESQGNTTRILIKPRPALGEGDQPLAGITVALDPGHGGNDPGALGIGGSVGPVEKDINLSTALAVRQYLRGLGATVVMTRDDDTKYELEEILQFFRDPSIDVCISLHSNSIFAGDGTKASGVEIFQYDAGSLDFAEALQTAIVAQTNRKDRTVKNDYYKVTLNSLSPTVLVEMGFLTHPAEYDALCSPEEIYAFAVAIGDGIIAELSKTAPPREHSPAENTSQTA